jgi:hypothetical protein
VKVRWTLPWPDPGLRLVDMHPAKLGPGIRAQGVAFRVACPDICACSSALTPPSCPLRWRILKCDTRWKRKCQVTMKTLSRTHIRLLDMDMLRLISTVICVSWISSRLTPIRYGHALVQFDRKAEARLRLKIDLCVIPTVALLYLFCFIDRANIGNARLAGLEKDLKLTGYDYNSILSVFYISYIIFEVQFQSSNPQGSTLSHDVATHTTRSHQTSAANGWVQAGSFPSYPCALGSHQLALHSCTTSTRYLRCDLSWASSKLACCKATTTTNPTTHMNTN